MIDFFMNLGDWALHLVGTPWIVVIIMLFTTIDGFFPVVPSESVIIGAAVIIAADDGVNLLWILLAGAIGAFLGDFIAYHLGRLLPVRRMRLFQGERGARALRHAEKALHRRAPLIIMSARFIPLGRVAVNMTAGAISFPLSRFGTIITFSAVMWAGTSVLLGIAAGHFLQDHPLVAVVVGVFLGVLIGWLIDKVMTLINKWLSRPGHGTTKIGGAVLRGTERPQNESDLA